MSEDWAIAFRFAVLRLGLAPADFWNLTLLEWRTLTKGASSRGGALSRGELSELLTQYPRYQTGT